jgi:hypothetical protein
MATGVLTKESGLPTKTKTKTKTGKQVCTYNLDCQDSPKSST